MPIYEYEHLDPEHPGCEEVVDAMQSISDENLTACPECGNPVRRIVSKPNFSIGINMSADATAKKGFTTYRKSGSGTYEKAAGEGPDTISAGPE